MDYLKLAERRVMNRIARMDSPVDKQLIQYIIRGEAQRMIWRHKEQLALNKLKDNKQHLLILHGSDSCVCDGDCFDEEHIR